MYLKNEGGLGAEQGETSVGKVVISPLDANVLLVVRIGQESLMEDNLLDDDIEIELAPIAVQLAYVQQVKLLHYVYIRLFLVLVMEAASDAN